MLLARIEEGLAIIRIKAMSLHEAERAFGAVINVFAGSGLHFIPNPFVLVEEIGHPDVEGVGIADDGFEKRLRMGGPFRCQDTGSDGVRIGRRGVFVFEEIQHNFHAYFFVSIHITEEMTGVVKITGGDEDKTVGIVEGVVVGDGCRMTDYLEGMSKVMI